MHYLVCQLTPQLSLVLIEPTHIGMVRPSRPGWLLLHRNGLLALGWLPIFILTGPGVAQLR